jgi:hypothetical protein
VNRFLVHWVVRQGKTLTEDTPRFGGSADPVLNPALFACSIRGKPAGGNREEGGAVAQVLWKGRG